MKKPITEKKGIVIKELSIQKRLRYIQSELKAPKKQFNAFAKFSYRSCENILEAVKPILKEYRTILVLSDEIVTLGERFYVKATAIITNIDDDDSITVTAFAREEESKKGMDGSQITGAASSYARKYALNGLFGIDDSKDSDTINKGDVVEKKAIAKPLSDKEIKAIGVFLQKIIDAKSTDELDKIAGLVKKQNFNINQQRVLKTSWLGKVKRVSK